MIKLNSLSIVGHHNLPMTRQEKSASKVRVAVVLPTHWSYISGGAEQQVRYLLEPLSRQADVTYFAGNVGSEFSSRDYRVVNLGRGEPPGRRSRLCQAVRLFRELQTLRPDVIYQRVGCAYTGAAAAYARRHGARMVWHVASEADVVPLSRGIHSPLELLEKRLLEFGIRCADQVVVQCEDQSALIETHYGRRDAVLVRNFHPVPKLVKVKPSRFRILWIANYKPLKRPQVFIDVARRLQHLDCDFVMIGRLPDSPSIAGSANLQHLGPVSHERVNQLLSESHLLLNTSTYEGFSNTFVQAWLRSVPVVTLGVDPDRMISGCALGVVARDVDELVRVAQSLVLDPEQTSRMGARARLVAVEEFSLKNSEKLVDLILNEADVKGIGRLSEPSRTHH